MKIVVVGNGSSVLNYEFGKLIDTFDEVVRFNFYEIEGYEKHVGTKTTIWFRNSGPMIERDESQFKQVILQTVDYPNEHTDHSVYERYPRVDDEIIKEIREVVPAPGLNLSTGIQALGYMTRLHGRIHIHGFDVFDPPRLYFEPMNRLVHSLDERKYIDHLKEKGLVVELSQREMML